MSAATPSLDVKASLPQMAADDGVRVLTKLLVGHTPDGTPKFVQARLPRNVIGRKALVTIVTDAEGNLIPVWESWATRIRITDDFEEITGIPVSRQTIHAWILCGFVDGWCPGPNLTWVCLTSLARFIDQIKAPHAREFWTEENLRRYLDAYDTVRSQGLKARLPRATRELLARISDDPDRPVQMALWEAEGEDGGLRTEDRGQRTEDRSQKSEATTNPKATAA